MKFFDFVNSSKMALQCLIGIFKKSKIALTSNSDKLVLLSSSQSFKIVSEAKTIGFWIIFSLPDRKRALASIFLTLNFNISSIIGVITEISEGITPIFIRFLISSIPLSSICARLEKVSSEQ